MGEDMTDEKKSWQKGDGKLGVLDPLIGSWRAEGCVRTFSRILGGSYGQRSEGTLVDAGDLHAEAIGFEAEMPAGLARMVSGGRRRRRLGGGIQGPERLGPLPPPPLHGALEACARPTACNHPPPR
jgi:hypothetical protein